MEARSCLQICDLLDDIKQKSVDLNVLEHSVNSANFEIGVLNLILSSVAVNDNLFYATVKVFDSFDRFVNIYGFNAGACGVKGGVYENSRDQKSIIVVVDIHISKTIEEILLKQNWLIVISVKNSRRIFTKIVRLDLQSLQTVLPIEDDGKFVNHIDVMLLINDQNRVPFQIFVNINEIRTNIFNFFHPTIDDKITENKKLVKFTIGNTNHLDKIYENILRHFYYNLDVNEFEKFTGNVGQWPTALFGFIHKERDPILLEFKFRNNLLKMTSSPKNVFAMKSFLIDDSNIGFHRDSEFSIPVSTLTTLKKMRINLKDNDLKPNRRENVKNILSELNKLTRLFFT